MPRSEHPPDSLLAAIAVLNRARASMLDQMAEQVLAMADDFAEGGFQVNEFLELNGSRLHFLCLLIGQFEMLREARLSEAAAAEAKPKPSARRSKPREEPPGRPAGGPPPSAAGEGSGTDS